ncbi:MAG: hypothetical protein IJK62_04070 [Bacteroidales bacterium]|nr:hypothetical protein [Bacteroidales bacterium]
MNLPAKLYIPTTTLNFNNIMSSESISPASFYGIRGFGFKRFETVRANPLQHRLLMYSRYPIFDIEDSDLANYPLVIEINTSSVVDDIIHEKNDVFYSDQTIYLSPFSTRFIFRNSSELNETISKSERSIESKLVCLYRNCFLESNSNIESFNWTEKNLIEDYSSDTSMYISLDRRINKMKGLIYAYLSAANKPMSKDFILLKKLFKQLKNTLSAALNSPSATPTALQKKQLADIYVQINSILKNQNIGSIKPYKDFGRKHKDDITNKDTINKLDLHLDQIQEYINLLESNVCHSKIQEKDLPHLQNLKIIDKTFYDKKEFVVKLLNKFSEEAYSKEDFLQSRYEFAKEGGKLFKEVLSTKWEGSESQTYINSLLKNLNEYKPFDLMSIDNLTLRSFAAFCQKGDPDIENLQDYLIDNNISDFRLAYALWGVIFGYAEMPKSLTNDFYECNDLIYKECIYKFIFNQLHCIELDGDLPEEHESTKLLANESKSNISEPATSSKEQTIVNYPSKINKATFGEEYVIPTGLIPLFESDKFSKLTPEAQKFAKTKVLSIYNNDDDLVALIDKLEGIQFPKYGRKHICTSTEWKKCVKELRSKNRKTTYKDSDNKLFTEKDFPLGKYFCNDKNIWYHIQHLILEDKKVQSQVKEDLDWFIDNYQASYYDKKQKVNKEGQYFVYPKDNAKTIEHYKKYCEAKLYPVSKSGKDMKWLRNIYQKVEIDTIINRLKQLYEVK